MTDRLIACPVCGKDRWVFSTSQSDDAPCNHCARKMEAGRTPEEIRAAPRRNPARPADRQPSLAQTKIDEKIDVMARAGASDAQIADELGISEIRACAIVGRLGLLAIRAGVRIQQHASEI